MPAMMVPKLVAWESRMMTPTAIAVDVTTTDENVRMPAYSAAASVEIHDRCPNKKARLPTERCPARGPHRCFHELYGIFNSELVCSAHDVQRGAQREKLKAERTSRITANATSVSTDAGGSQNQGIVIVKNRAATSALFAC